MRVRSLSATALAAATIFQPFAIAQVPAVKYGSVHAANVVQDAAASASTSSATTTHTVTMTVMRVVQTEYATRNSTAIPSFTLTPFSNGTASVLGTGAGPSMTATESAVPMLPSGAASQLGLDVVGLVAAAGVVGFFVAQSQLDLDAHALLQAHKLSRKLRKSTKAQATGAPTQAEGPSSSMQRVKNVDFDEDELYDDGEEYGEEPETHSQEDRANFAALIPVVRAELEEVGLQASDKEIKDALWNYYWDVGKTVTYLKNNRTPRPQQQAFKKQEKRKSKFDEAAERSAKGLGESGLPLPKYPRSVGCGRRRSAQDEEVGHDIKSIVESPADNPKGTLCMLSPSDWFQDVPWTLPLESQGNLVPAALVYRPRLLGGSSKLVKPVEERGNQAAIASAEGATANGVLSSLDRPDKPKEPKENKTPSTVAEPKKSPIREKREPTPPPASGLEEEQPDLRAQPTAFARTLSARPTPDTLPAAMSLLNLLGVERSEDPFKGPSPDGTVTKAQNRSKGMTKRP
ncbi:hypothetical protein LTR91_000909 [Friedmanniomyces endolithicus]|uniref:HBS1-like protein N-terminal domain-containing protein n=1 Tax=Friedmanniomyces endolithicus TaxID=329885 RepID=A0AAN6L0X2_9PEZI|nr:hypothetical protein LTR94_011654 [Friedmanniomyces endolithicus]KAK0791447.1 hypothetical protein LTR38_010222 [Friedmanniomyces endolithicus]KAK0803227.1 hypothetical protein LTR59_004790 [Friedmanniomyces endolithicus]KAK0849669.1 hypothetical protein LTR03_005087 [Friedmanniomyces endolithicus]KAK0862926.1 hypothetical protein LTS02_006870 [Friedmanniomyces endolithicus]